MTFFSQQCNTIDSDITPFCSIDFEITSKFRLLIFAMMRLLELFGIWIQIRLMNMMEFPFACYIMHFFSHVEIMHFFNIKTFAPTF